MANPFGPMSRHNGGVVKFNAGSGELVNPVKFQGLNLDTSGAIYAQNNGVITHYHNGLPFNLHGRLVIGIGNSPVRFDQGLAFDANDRVCVGGPSTHYNAGVAFDRFGALADANVGPLGPELLTDPDFLIDGSPLWVKGDGWVVAGGQADVDGTQIANSLLSQSNIVAPEKTYSLSFQISGYVAGTIFPIIGGVVGPSQNANGIYTFIGTTPTVPDNTAAYFRADLDGTMSLLWASCQEVL